MAEQVKEWPLLAELVALGFGEGRVVGCLGGGVPMTRGFYEQPT